MHTLTAEMQFPVHLLQLFAPPQTEITRYDHVRALAESLSTLRRWLALNRTLSPQ
jgi:hypothetical protein